MSAVPYREWTDAEWIRAMREFQPKDDIREVEQAVARWREQEGG